MTNHIGLIGLGVMGQNLARNIARNGYAISVFDREAAVLEKFLASNSDQRIHSAPTPAEFIQSLERPRKIILLVKAGEAVDWTIELVKPYLERDDLIVDSGNSFFKDTARRQQQLQSENLFLIGSAQPASRSSLQCEYQQSTVCVAHGGWPGPATRCACARDVSEPCLLRYSPRRPAAVEFDASAERLFRRPQV